jgi:hypothetical protein
MEGKIPILANYRRSQLGRSIFSIEVLEVFCQPNILE